MDDLIGKIGFTSDGMIFHITDAMMPDGQKLQATFTYTPEQAVSIAEKLQGAVQAGHEAKRLQEIAGNGGSNSSADRGGST